MDTTFQSKLNDLITEVTRSVLGEFVVEVVKYVNSRQQSTPLTAEELIENVHPQLKITTVSKLSRPTSVKSTPVKSKVKVVSADTEPPEGTCGYVVRVGKDTGTYCIGVAEGEVYVLTEGKRQFCLKCKNTKQVVKDIIAGKTNTLIPQKKTAVSRKGKGKTAPETPDGSRPGDYSTSVPDASNNPVRNIVPYGNTKNLFRIVDTDHILYREDDNTKTPFCLVASLVNATLSPATEESRDWAVMNQIEIVDHPDLFSEGGESSGSHEESAPEEEEEPAPVVKEASPPPQEVEEEPTPEVVKEASPPPSEKEKPLSTVRKSKATTRPSVPKEEKVSAKPNALLPLPGQKKK